MKVNVSGKPKHTLDVNRNNDVGADKGSRSAATVRRLKMYNVRSKRGRKEKILKQDLQSKDLPNTRIEPDRLWFGALPLSPQFLLLCYSSTQTLSPRHPCTQILVPLLHWIFGGQVE